MCSGGVAPTRGGFLRTGVDCCLAAVTVRWFVRTDASAPITLPSELSPTGKMRFDVPGSDSKPLIRKAKILSGRTFFTLSRMRLLSPQKILVTCERFIAGEHRVP